MKLGYLNDPYCQSLHSKPSTRPQPLINRGTWLRCKTIDSITRDFVRRNTQDSKKCQIVSLGAGSDSRYFCLREDFPGADLNFFEMDFEEITTAKTSLIELNVVLATMLDSPEFSGSGIKSRYYSLIACDLRRWNECVKLMEAFGFEKTMPTLVVSECVLIYMSPTEGDDIISWFGINCCDGSQFLTFEQIKPDDAFGKVMISNLMSRGITLHGILGYPTVEAQKKRYIERGWSQCMVADMIQIYNNCVSESEKKRVSKLEMMDELEEFTFLLQHYCTALSVKNAKQLELTLETIKKLME